MGIVAFILALAAIIVFALSAIGTAAKVNLIGLGLALLSAAWVVQSVFGGSTVHG